MEKDSKKITDRDLVRCNIDSGRLDGLIRDFKASGYRDEIVLYVIATAGDAEGCRGAVLFVVDLNRI